MEDKYGQLKASTKGLFGEINANVLDHAEQTISNSNVDPDFVADVLKEIFKRQGRQSDATESKQKAIINRIVSVKENNETIKPSTVALDVQIMIKENWKNL